MVYQSTHCTVETTDHYSVAGSGMTAGAGIKTAGEIISKPSEGPLGPRYAVSGGNPSLQFESPSVSLEAPPPGVTAATGSTTGKLMLEGHVFMAGHQRVRCDKSKRFVGHFDYLLVEPSGLWGDAEGVNIADAGIVVRCGFAFAEDGWGEAFTKRPDPRAPLDPSQYVVLRVSPEHPESADSWLPGVKSGSRRAPNGNCSRGKLGLNECRDYSFNATFQGQGLPGDADSRD